MLNRHAVAASVWITLALVVPQARAAKEQERQTTWEGLSVLVGKKVRVVMPDGARIEAKALAVETDALVVDIRKTTNKAAYPKGKFLVPRATLKAVAIDQPTRRGRLIGTSSGLAFGSLLGVLAVETSKGGPGTSTGVSMGFGISAVGVVVAGYLIGRTIDRQTITYLITP